MRNKIFGLVGIIYFVFSLVSCNTPSTRIDVPDEMSKSYINEDTLVSLLVDIHLADGYLSVNKNDFVKHLKKIGVTKEGEGIKGFYASVFKKHGVTNTEFYKTLEYYSFHQDELLKIYERVLDSLNMRMDTIRVLH
jgi:hypothetical protein